MRKLASIFAIACLVASVTSATQAEATDSSAIHVVFRATSENAAHEAADSIGAVQPVRVLPGLDLYRISEAATGRKGADEINTDRLAGEIASETGVAWAVPASPDGNFAEAWSFYAWPDGRYSGSKDGLHLDEFLNLEEVHQVATGRRVTVAVLDTGFDEDHPELTRRWTNGGIDLAEGHPNVGDWLNGIDDDGDGKVDEAHGHGTFVAGIVAQIAPGAKILPIRVLEADGSGQLWSVIEGIDTAVALGADVINMSFGVDRNHVELENAIARATAAGVVVVASAGNEGTVARQYPAQVAGVISVAAYDPEVGSLADFSSSGRWVDVSAPGVDVVSTLPGGNWGTWSGSSLASPIVAAQVALILELNSKLSPAEIEQIVVSSAVDANGVDVGLIDIMSLP